MKKLGLLCMLVAMIMVSCSQDDNSIDMQSIFYDTEAPDDNIEKDPEMVTVPNLPTAVYGQFDENSTGKALLNRLETKYQGYQEGSKMILLKSDEVLPFANDVENVRCLTRMMMNGGLLAIERPSIKDIFVVTAVFVMGVIDYQLAEIDDNFDLTDEQKQEAREHSAIKERAETRLNNMRRLARRAGIIDDNEVIAEMIILGMNEYFYMEPFKTEETAELRSEDTEGQLLESILKKQTFERNSREASILANGVACWLNEIDKNRSEAQAEARSHLLSTRADGGNAINALMDASETFTFNGNILTLNTEHELVRSANRVQMTVRSWGVHDIDSNKDYYYIKQNVTVSMGDRGYERLFIPREEDKWTKCNGFGDYPLYYGSFLSNYETSMELTGNNNDNIQLEAATPATENQSTTISINVGYSESSSSSIGYSWSSNAGYNGNGPLGSITSGISKTDGKTNGSSFSMNNSRAHKDLEVHKNRDGNKVTWTYKGNLPKGRRETGSDAYHYKHDIAPAILVSDADLTNEICWSVANPTGTYTLNITSYPQTAVLLQSKTIKENGEYARKYEYTNTYTQSNFKHEFLQPNRFLQTWRMSITVDEWEDRPDKTALKELENYFTGKYPDIYRSVFTVADKTETSVQVINAIIENATNAFDKQKDILQELAQNYGIKAFSIHWRCDNENLRHKKDYTIEVPEFKLIADRGTGTDEFGFANLIDDSRKTKWMAINQNTFNGDNVPYIEFHSTIPITVGSYSLVTADDAAEYPSRNPSYWRLYGKQKPEDEWTLMDDKDFRRNYEDGLPARSNKMKTFELNGTKLKNAKYFRFEVNYGYGTVFQIAELYLNN